MYHYHFQAQKKRLLTNSEDKALYVDHENEVGTYTCSVCEHIYKDVYITVLNM